MNAPAIDWERITRAALPVETVERVAEHEPGGMTAIHWQAPAVRPPKRERAKAAA
jgi:hypothetical protein